MKVIQQLVAYFEGQGRLNPRQVRELVEKGYWGQYTSGDLRTQERKIGQSFFFQVKGDSGGPLWGTDVYTSDSSLGSACVHAGILDVGEAGVVKVTMVKPPATFKGCPRNGVVSRDWHTGWSGAYTVESVRR